MSWARPGHAARQYTATFTPEAWIRGQAIEVDPEGPVSWDCTAFALTRLSYLAAIAARSPGHLDDGAHVLDNDDVFKDDPAAPEWIRSWRGPFTIRITAAASGRNSNP